MQQKKEFIKKPEYPGGKAALKKYIHDNLRYPNDALEAKIQGVVAVSYEVDDDGNVVSSKIITGLYPSCDEEALRLVNSLKYCPVRNRGLRIKSTFKINIFFRIDKTEKQLLETINIQYTYVTTPKKDSDNNDDKMKGEVYSYSITF